MFAGQNVGIREVEESIWLVNFTNYDLVFVYYETDRIECAEKSARCYRVGLTDVAGMNRG